MLWVGFLFAFFIAAALAAVFVGLFGWRRPGAVESESALWAFLWFFLVVFLVTWLFGLWVRPFGPFAWGVPWLAFLVIGFVVALVLAAVSAPHPRRRPRGDVPAQPSPESVAAAGAGLFFWVLLIVLLLLILIGALFEAYEPLGGTGTAGGLPGAGARP